MNVKDQLLETISRNMKKEEKRKQKEEDRRLIKNNKTEAKILKILKGKAGCSSTIMIKKPIGCIRVGLKFYHITEDSLERFCKENGLKLWYLYKNSSNGFALRRAERDDEGTQKTFRSIYYKFYGYEINI